MRILSDIAIDIYRSARKAGTVAIGPTSFGRVMGEIQADRAAAHAFALALAVLTWLHGSQEPDARAELDAWMRAGIAVTGAKGDDGRVRVRPAEEGDRVIGETMTDASGLQYVKTWAVLIDDQKAKP